MHIFSVEIFPRLYFFLFVLDQPILIFPPQIQPSPTFLVPTLFIFHPLRSPHEVGWRAMMISDTLKESEGGNNWMGKFFGAVEMAIRFIQSFFRLLLFAMHRFLKVLLQLYVLTEFKQWQAGAPLFYANPFSPENQELKQVWNNTNIFKEYIIFEMEKAIDLPRLKSMIKNGIASIPKDPNADQAIIVIGDTGVGKSTLLAFLSGQDLIVRYDGLKPVLDCADSSIKIGHEKYSETSIPNKIVIDNLAFYDCPGFRDNKGEEYEISNSFFVQRLLDIYPKVKIVILLDESHISEARADKLPRLTKNLLKSFKTFDDIKEGVIVIINRAERDLKVTDYHKEIRKMCELKNERGPLFEAEEEKFLKFLVSNNRILLFREPRKEDKNKSFIPSESENSILRTIKYCNFVKSKHILNILSESAKLAIRDFIDDITAKSNLKIERICQEIVSTYSMKISKKGKDIEGLLDLKDEVISLAEEIKSAEKEKIVQILQREVSESNTQDFTEDFAAVMFFKGIYDKTATYFSNLVNKIYTELSHLLVKMDHRILKVQKDEQQEIEKRKKNERKREIEEKRIKDRQRIQNEMRSMEKVKIEAAKIEENSNELGILLQSALDCIGGLQNDFKELKSQTKSLDQMNKNSVRSIESLENRYLNSVSEL